MLFDNTPTTFESEKERNFYYKILAGYYFNELIPGYEDRLKSFCDLIHGPKYRGLHAPSQRVILNPAYTHVSFDNHIYLFTDAIDRGEFADILLHDKTTNNIATIEAKLHTNWSYQKDIISNKRRIDYINSKLPNVTFYPILLLIQQRWDQVKKIENHLHSNYTAFMDDHECPFKVLFWQQIGELILDNNVKQYMDSQLNRLARGLKYRFENEWFVQNQH